MARKTTTTTIAFLAFLVAVGVMGQPQGQQGQQGGQRGQGGQQGEVRNECFQGEGSLTFLRPDSTFPPNVEKFSYDVFRTLSEVVGDSSAIMSPYSIWSVLSLAYFGSFGNTKRELEAALRFTNKTHAHSNWRALRFFLESGVGGGVELGVSNKGYFSNDLTLNPCLLQNVFDLQTLDFTQAEAARQVINKEVSTATRGHINELISFLPPETRMALVNAVFFKGSWEVQFDPILTRPQEFLVPPGRSSGVVSMMTRVAETIVGEAPTLASKLIELPYLNSTVSMFLLLPDDPMAPLSDLVARLTPQTFSEAVRALPTTPVMATLSLPKFKMATRYETELKEALSRLGVRSLFDRRTSDLRGFATADPPLAVDTVIHQATVEVTEEGTVAAAATALIDTRLGPPRTLQITFNRPFIFSIVDKRTRLPLFIGKVASAADLQKP